MGKNGISLRYKILAALTILPVVGISLFLALAVNIFEKDKIAYVFDSSLSVSKTKAARVSAEVNSLISITNSVVLSYKANTKELAESGIYFFQRELKFLAFQLHAFDPVSKQYTRTIDLQKDAVKSMMEVEQQNIQEMLATARDKSIVINLSKADPTKILFGARFGAVEDPQHVIAVAMFDEEELANAFNENSPYKSFLTRNSGEALFSAKFDDPRDAGWRAPQIWKILAEKKVPEGIGELQSPSGQPYLASFAGVGVGDLVIISLVNKHSALQAVNILMRKSLLFFIAVISATLFISVLASRSLTQALSTLVHFTQKVAEGDFNVHADVKSRDEIGQLATSFNVMAIEVSRLMGETADKARMESELATAKTVQETLFPESNSTLGEVEISGHYTPASECGGDWWYYFENGDYVYLWIADATGHGAPAALLTSAARAVASVIQGGPSRSPAQSLGIMNRAIWDCSKGGMMMTFFLACINKKTGLMIYSNASHEAPLLLKKSDQAPGRDDFIPLIDCNNPRLGEQMSLPFKEAKIQLDPGDRLVFYTDGVLDVKNLEKKAWGERRFLKALSASMHENTETAPALKQIMSSLWEYREATPLDDDVTLIFCRYKGAA